MGRARLPNDLKRHAKRFGILGLLAGNDDAPAEPVHGAPMSPATIARGRGVLSAEPRTESAPVIVVHAGPGSARASELVTNET